MTRRPALGRATAALCALLALTACQGSPEAGRPNTTPAPSTPTPNPTAPSTPTWTPEELQAVDAAETRYTIARTAVNKALQSPATATRPSLVKAGNGGAWLISILGQSIQTGQRLVPSRRYQDCVDRGPLGESHRRSAGSAAGLLHR